MKIKKKKIDIAILCDYGSSIRYCDFIYINKPSKDIIGCYGKKFFELGHYNTYEDCKLILNDICESIKKGFPVYKMPSTIELMSYKNLLEQKKTNE